MLVIKSRCSVVLVFDSKIFTAASCPVSVCFPMNTLAFPPAERRAVNVHPSSNACPTHEARGGIGARCGSNQTEAAVCAMESTYLSVFFLDGTSKTVSVDEDTTFHELAAIVVDCIELQQAQKDFRFFLVIKNEESLLTGDQRPLDVLQMQETSQPPSQKDPKLVFKRVFFMEPIGENYIDPVLVRLVFAQAKEQVLSGRWEVSDEHAAELGGILMAAMFRDTPEAQTVGFVRQIVRTLVPAHMFARLKPAVWEAGVLRSFREHASLGFGEACLRYVDKARESARQFGTIFFPATYARKDDLPIQLRSLIGVCSEGVAMVREPDLRPSGFFQFVDIISWGCEGHTLVITTRLPEDTRESVHRFRMEHPHNVTLLIAGYIERIVEAIQGAAE
eukprot:gnl/Chilomastix_cuspidata/1987.p1 GENE.gnl/Chilomastix_cuspidata/1987~~gnl/Chilomastix_cuspidata/1987.p1  ORF type:complete len:391 (-),score=87.89 gnl/Chilomastix_cuspidata/1987:47-1219(-)